MVLLGYHQEPVWTIYLGMPSCQYLLRPKTMIRTRRYLFRAVSNLSLY